MSRDVILPPAKRRREDDDFNTQLQSFHNGHPATNAPPLCPLVQYSYAPPPTYAPSLPCPTPTGQPPPVADMMAALSDQDVRGLLTAIAQSDPSYFAHAILTDHYTRHVHAQHAKVVSFDHHSKSAWYTLNKSYCTKLSGSKQYEASWGAMAEVTGCIHAIAEGATPASSYGTKLSALETLRKIGKTVLLSSGDCLTSEVRKQFQSDHCLESVMISILEEVGKPNLLEKTRWVHNEGDGYCIFENLGYAVEMLEYGEGQGEHEEEDEDEGEHNDQGEEEEDDSFEVLNPITARPSDGL